MIVYYMNLQVKTLQLIQNHCSHVLTINCLIVYSNSRYREASRNFDNIFKPNMKTVNPINKGTKINKKTKRESINMYSPTMDTEYWSTYVRSPAPISKKSTWSLKSSISKNTNKRKKASICSTKCKFRFKISVLTLA